MVSGWLGPYSASSCTSRRCARTTAVGRSPAACAAHSADHAARLSSGTSVAGGPETAGAGSVVGVGGGAAGRGRVGGAAGGLGWVAMS